MSTGTPSNPLTGYTDQELLEWMAMKDDDLETAHAAFREFHARFHKVIGGALFTLCQEYANNKQLAKDLFNNTFMNAYKYAGSFSVGMETDPSVIRKLVIGWLLEIARTELRGMFDDKRKKTDLRLLHPRETDTEVEQEVYQSAMITNARASPKDPIDADRLEKIKKAIGLIPKDRDREIFEIYWLHYIPGTGGKAKKLPDKVSQMLADKYNTTKDNVRQIVSRCMKLVKQYLDENIKKIS